MIAIMETTGTVLLTHEPEPERLVEIVDEIAREIGLPGNTVNWFISQDVPPNINVSERDQLEAHRRDLGPDAIYLTVLVTDD
jgi:hypothetical protein